MFGVVDRLLLRPPEHVVAPDQVRRVLREGLFFGDFGTFPATTYPDLEDLRTIPEFSSVGGVTGEQRLTVGAGEGARQVRAVLATHDFFATLGVRPHLGRFFSAQDDQPDAQATVVVSREYWETSMGAAPDVLGRTLELAGHPMTVIGVAPQGFTGVDLSPVDVWLPAVMAQKELTGRDRFLTSRTYWWLRSVVRVREGEALEAGEAKATAMHVNSRAEAVAAGRADGNARIVPAPLLEAWGPEATNESKVARWLAGVSLIVLLIACANVANLLLARGAGRRREIAVRLSLGVSRGRLLRDLVFEALILAGAGGVVALALAHWGGSLIRAVLIPDVLWTAPSLSVRVVAFTALVSLAAGLLAGFGPALQSARADLLQDLSDGGRGSSGKRATTRRFLTAAQAALSAILLVGAGLFIRSVIEVRRADLGVDVGHLVQATLEFRGDAPDFVEATRLYQEAAQAARPVTGVEQVAATDVLFQWASIRDLRVPGMDSLPVPPSLGPFYHGVSPGYLATMGLDLLEGRDIAESDREGSPKVAVVNAVMARTLWPDQEPLGQCFHVEEDEECTTVVGIMENAFAGDLDGRRPLAYLLPLAQVPSAPAGLFLRTGADPDEVAARLAPILRSFSPRVRFAQIRTVQEMMDPQTRAWTLGATLFSVFGLLALVVAAIGLYSLLAFDVAHRTREIGIRAALGAARPQVLSSVLFSGVRLVVVGVIVGTGVAQVAARFAEDLLFHVEGHDPVVLGVVVSLLLIVALAASVVPGMRATRIDPAQALRAD